jgi:single-strand DNA-binding protein
MAGLNKVMIIGNLGKDPEMRSWKNQEGQLQEETEWFSVEAWGKLAEITNEYLSKGKKVYVEGRLRTHSWEDQTTGEKKYRTNVVATDVQFIEPRGSQSGDGGLGDSQAAEPAQSFDEMPF